MSELVVGQRRGGLRFDASLVVLTTLLVGIGLIWVYSATFGRAAQASHDVLCYPKRQAAAALLGAAAMALLALLSMQRLRQAAYAAAAVSAVLLVAVLIVGEEVNGAHRWFKVGSYHIQPSEFAKLAVVLAAARYAVERSHALPTLRGLVPPLGAAALLGGLVLVEPDLGAAAVMVALAFLVCHFGGARLRHLAIWAALGLAVLVVSIVAVPYRRERVREWLRGDPDSLATGYQLRHSVLALGAGGPAGRGIGAGGEKYGYLPAAETDCIFAVIGEEVGLIGTWGLLALFAVLGWRGVKASLRATAPFHTLVGAGVTAMILLQVLIHVAVVTGAAPTKGTPLPFVSYGGSSLVCNMAAVGLLLNVSRQRARRALALGR